MKMSVISMKQLLEAGVHFGHQTRRWNPKMAPYIFTERNGIYIIDLQKTVKKAEEAYNFIKEVAAEGKIQKQKQNREEGEEEEDEEEKERLAIKEKNEVRKEEEDKGISAYTYSYFGRTLRI